MRNERPGKRVLLPANGLTLVLKGLLGTVVLIVVVLMLQESWAAAKSAWLTRPENQPQLSPISAPEKSIPAANRTSDLI